MSRKITIKSDLKVSETDLAEEVVNEMREKGVHSLRFDSNERVFFNQQYDDIEDDTIQQAEQLYGIKLQQRLIRKIEDRLKNNHYKVEITEHGNKIKIVAKRYVYA